MQSIYTWGVHSAQYLPPSTLFLLAVFSVLLAIFATSSGVANIFSGRYSRPAIIGGWLFLSLALWFFRTQNTFLGDGATILSSLGNPVSSYFSNQVDYALHQLFYQNLIAPVKLPPVFAYSITSVIAGFGFIAILFKTVCLLTLEYRKRLPLFVLLFFSGYSLQFYGYVESYTLLLLSIALYLFLALKFMKGDTFVLWPFLALVLSVFLHQIALLLFPSFCYLIWVDKKRILASSKKRLAVIAIVVLTSLVFFVLIFKPLNLFNMLKESGVLDLSIFLPLRGPYALFSINHIIDWINAQLLAGGVLFLMLPFAVAFGFKKREPYFIFLFLAHIFLLVFFFLLNTKIEMFRDWDIVALPVMVYCLFVVQFLVGLDFQKPGRLFHGIVLFLAIFHSGAWVLLNHSPDASLQRFIAMVERSNRSADNGVVGYNYEQIADYYMKQGDVQSEFIFRRKSVELTNNPRHYNNLGNIYARQKDYAKAIDCYQKALLGKPDFMDPALNLAKAFFLEKDYQAAIRHCQANVPLFPKEPILQQVWVSSLFQLGRYDSSVAIGLHFLRYNPCDLEILLTLGTACMEKKVFLDSEKFFLKAQECSPNNPRAYAGLAGLFVRQGKRDEALKNYLLAKQIGWPLDTVMEVMLTK